MVETKPFDPAEYPDSDEAIGLYMMGALEPGDPRFVWDVLAVISRARDMTEMAARRVFPQREPIPGVECRGNPRSRHVLRVVRALDRQFSIIPVRQYDATGHEAIVAIQHMALIGGRL